MYVDSISTNPWFWLAWFSIAALMGYWNYRKGHNFFIGMFISALVTPLVALLFLLFGKSNQTVLRQRKEKAGGVRRCPSCNRAVPDNSRRCPNCGKKFKTEPIL